MVDGKWLYEKLPCPPLDIFQDDNVRKVHEAENCYIVCIGTAIVDDKLYTE